MSKKTEAEIAEIVKDFTPRPNIFQRINSVMRDVDYIQKGDKKVNGQYRFVSHDQVVAALHGPMTIHGIACIPTVEELKQDGNRSEVRLKVFFYNIDNPTDAIAVTYYGYGIDGADKGVGKAISYALKYALLKTFCLETGDDPDSDTEVEHKPKKAESEYDKEPPSQELISDDQVLLLNQTLGDDIKLTAKVLKVLEGNGIYSFKDLPVGRYAGLMKYIQDAKKG